MTIRNIQIAAMWVFLAPLILILGTLDVATKGRSRSWPLGDQAPNDPNRGDQ